MASFSFKFSSRSLCWVHGSVWSCVSEFETDFSSPHFFQARTKTSEAAKIDYTFGHNKLIWISWSDCPHSPMENNSSGGCGGIKTQTNAYVQLHNCTNASGTVWCAFRLYHILRKCTHRQHILTFRRTVLALSRPFSFVERQKKAAALNKHK